MDLSNPECYNLELLIEGLTMIKNGKSFLCPYYDTNTDEILKDFTEIKPTTPLILLEGMFILGNDRLMELLDFIIYVEVDDDIRLSRMRIIAF